jgi:hypothetical protein
VKKKQGKGEKYCFFSLGTGKKIEKEIRDDIEKA